jgi:hypothetical protein
VGPRFAAHPGEGPAGLATMRFGGDVRSGPAVGTKWLLGLDQVTGQPDTYQFQPKPYVAELRQPDSRDVLPMQATGRRVVLALKPGRLAALRVD